MFERVKQAGDAIREEIAELDRTRLSGAEAVALVELFAGIERIAAAGRTLATRRVYKTRSWQKDGHWTAAHVAATTGTSLGNAIGVLETARRLDELPLTKEAFCAGRPSEAQAREITGASPDRRAERALVEAAQTQTFHMLREECSRSAPLRILISRRLRIASIAAVTSGAGTTRMARSAWTAALPGRRVLS